MHGLDHGPLNGILAALPAHDLARLQPMLEPVMLCARQFLYTARAPIPAVHFLESGLVSLVARLERGDAVEVGMVGREGMVGLALALGADSAPEEAMVQTAGLALRMPADAFQEALRQSPGLMAQVLRYANALRDQAGQIAACNGRHAIGKRLARWLLMASDRLGTSVLPLTQELLASMLGVRRAGICGAIGALQRAGILGFAAGRIAILDRQGLERHACECHAADRREYAGLRCAALARPAQDWPSCW
jgi:CRP-like cAMP-binding protein